MFSDFGRDLVNSLRQFIRPGIRHPNALRAEDMAAHNLIHRDGTRRDTASRVRNARKLQRALNRPVFSEPSVQRDKSDFRSHLPQGFDDMRRVVFHRFRPIAQTLQRFANGAPRIPGNFRFAGRTAHNDGNQIILFRHGSSPSLPIKKAISRPCG